MKYIRAMCARICITIIIVAYIVREFIKMSLLFQLFSAVLLFPIKCAPILLLASVSFSTFLHFFLLNLCSLLQAGHTTQE